MANANIFAQFARPVRSIAEYQDDAMQREAGALNLEGARRKNAMDAMTMQQGQEKRNAIQSILAGLPVNASDQQRIAAFRSNPNTLGEADALEKSVLERQKVGADVGKTDAETLTKHLSVLKDLAGSVMSDPTPQNAQLSLQIFERLTGRQMPEERQRIAGLQTPEQVKAWAAGHAIQAEKLLPKLGVQNQGDANVNTATDVLTGKVTTTGSMPINQSADNAATNLTRAEEGAAGRKVQLQIAGQADARAREGLRLQGERLAFDKTKTPDEKPLNDTQSKALLFGSRMREADKVLESLAKSGTKASVPGSRAGYGVGSVVTALSSSQQQQLDQAKRDFLSAVLRRESGAVISDSEFDNGDKQYFPQIGDSKDVIAQKARNRKLATDGILQEVPANRRDGLQPTPQMPTADDVRKQADAILKGG